MSVDKTIEELSGTLAQLGILVEHINTQIIGITARINMTLDNFDHSVAGIASDAGLMTGQVGDTISQVPSAWIFYLLFITLIIVLALLSVLIIINLVTRTHAVYKIICGDTSRPNSPAISVAYSESKQPLNTNYPISPPIPRDRLRHTTVQMDAEPRRFGLHDPMGTFNGSQDPGGGIGTSIHGTYYPPSRSTDELVQKERSHEDDDKMPPQIESNNRNEAHLRRHLNPKDPFEHQRNVNGVDVLQKLPPPKYQQQPRPFIPPYQNGSNSSTTFTKREAEPV